MKLCLKLLFLLAMLLPTHVIANHVTVDDYYKALAPTQKHQATNSEIVAYIELRHYRNLAFNDHLSSLVFDRYILELDKNHYYLLASDIKHFENFRFELDEALNAGNLDAAYFIFNRFQKRNIERMVYQINLIEHGMDKLDFSLEESLEVDREHAAWAKTPKALDALWRKRVKNTVLNLKLAGKSMEEIKTTLSKRFKSQLNRITQTEAEDAFRIYIKALTQTFDPHSEYFSPRASKNFNIHMSLSLEGIGAVLTSENEYTKVVRLIASGPADKGGELKPGDKIIGVGQGKKEIENVVGWRLGDVVEKIRGPKGTQVRLEVIHSKFSDDRTQTINIRRDKVKLEDKSAKKEILSVPLGDRTYKVGVIDLPTFYIDFEGSKRGDPNYKSTTRDVKKLILELKQAKVDGIIIDLRNNGGGSLQEANSLTGLFIKEGPTVQIRDFRHMITNLEDDDAGIFYDGPLAVLVNRLSASASEIFAGAIQDYQRGLIIGSQTFGKGTVQALLGLKQGQLKITHAMFFRVNGESTQNRGVIPNLTLPSLYDNEEFGESALARALPWSQIDADDYTRFPSFSPYLKSLKTSHQNRVKRDPGFNLLIEEITKLKELRERKVISLNEVAREKERTAHDAWQLRLENRKRKLQNLPPLEALEKKEEDGIVHEEDDDEDKLDPILTESGHILVDYISLISSGQ